MRDLYGAYNLHCPKCDVRLTYKAIQRGQCQGCGEINGVVRAFEARYDKAVEDAVERGRQRRGEG